MLLQVTFLGANSKLSVCQEARAVNSKAGVEFDCLEQRHFQPEVVQTYPYEQLSHAVLAWLQENSHRCDVVHGHEWGGAFLDAITALHFRQVATLSVCGSCTDSSAQLAKSVSIWCPAVMEYACTL